MTMQFKLQRDLPKDLKAAEIVRFSKLAGDFIMLNKVFLYFMESILQYHIEKKIRN